MVQNSKKKQSEQLLVVWEKTDGGVAISICAH